MFVQERLDIAAAACVDVASLAMVHPEPACVLDMSWNVFVHFSSAQVSCLSPRVLEVAHIAPQVLQHYFKTVLVHFSMDCALIDAKLRVRASAWTKKKVAERRVK
jgi:hypothetical protein